MANKILVTGATGNIGSEIIKSLTSKNADFVAGVTAQNKTIENVNSVLIDFNNADGLVNAFRGIDTLFLLYPMHEKMVVWNKTAVDSAKIAGVKHIVRSSGAGANENATSMVPKIQGTIDKYIKDSGIDYTITQPTFFMQNFLNFLMSDIKNGTVYQPLKRDALFNMVDVRDIAAVNAAILQSPKKYSSQSVVVAGSKNLTYPQALDIIGATIGKDINYVNVTDEAAIEAMKAGGFPQFIIDMTMSLNHITNNGDVIFRTSIIKDITDQEPVSFNSFAAHHKQAWLSA